MTEDKKMSDSLAEETMTETEDTASSVPETQNKEPVRQIPIHQLDMKRLIELDACTRCGECLSWCPVYDQDAREDLIPRRKIMDFLQLARSQNGFLSGIMKSEKVGESLKQVIQKVCGYKEITREQVNEFVSNLYECSTCGQCEVVCPAHIDTVNLWEDLRRLIVQAGYGPLEPQKALRKSVMTFDNPWQQPRAGRTKWSRRAKKDNLIADEPKEIKKTKGKVLLFFGCTASYDANVKQVAIHTMQDYPKIKALNFEVLHTVEYLARLLKSGELTFPYPVNKTVTYHDPCHLGRATGGFDAPRMIMEAIPGLTLVEMPRNREYSRCCGAGGGLKAGFPDIQGRMAQQRIKEAEQTGAEELVSCCPFCYQGLQLGIGVLESNIVMKDLSAYVAQALLGYDVFEKAEKEAEEKKREKEKAKAIKEQEKAAK
ncbi:MAG: (Fe-S)-binding protein [Desulfobacteraceae bacterium]|nr:(Fe-S)-binding protein [Desulfobacteraceae bacterium]